MTEEDDPEEAFVQVGRMGSAHGIDGEIRLFTAEPRSTCFEVGATLYVGGTDDSSAYTLESWRIADDFAIAKFEEITDRGEAERLTNLEVSVPAEVLPELGEREFYHHDLEGRDVYLQTSGAGESNDGSPRRIGEVEGIFETGANDVLVVTLEAGEELYVPMFEGAIAEMDPAGARVVLRPLESWAPDGTDI